MIKTPALLKPFPIIFYIALIGVMNNVSEFLTEGFNRAKTPVKAIDLAGKNH